jgi:peptide/nickel transport system ATP-binding protein
MQIGAFKTDSTMGKTIIRVNDLSVRFKTVDGDIQALSNISFDLKEGEILGIIGESGSGKSTLATAMMSLLPDNATVGGEVRFVNRMPGGLEDEEVVTSADTTGRAYFKLKRSSRKILDERLTTLRWKSIAMVFQGAMNSLNPVYTVRRQIKEVFDIHEPYMTMEDVNARIEESSKLAGFNTRFLDSYPHQLSGGMKQRAVISMALALNPQLIIADEPTTGLDVITQAKIIKELRKLRDTGLIKSMVIISHDVGVVSQLADRVAVLYAGKIMEMGTAKDVFKNSANPYTVALLRSYPSIRSTRTFVTGIPGVVPDLLNLPKACYFVERCFYVKPDCSGQIPSYIEASPGHKSLCLHTKEFINDLGEGKLKPSSEKIQESKDYTDSAYNVIETSNLTKYFELSAGASGSLFGLGKKKFVRAVDHIDMDIKKGQVLGVVGESGSGKTTLGRTILMTIRPTSGKIIYSYQSDGEIKNINVSGLHERSHEFKAYRKATQLIFQDPYDSINPKMTILDIVAEPLMFSLGSHTFAELDQMKATSQNASVPKKKAHEQPDILAEVSRALEIANLTPASNYINRYPHELSGGERQRVSIARALIQRPDFLLADEPISMLDVSIRANVMNLLLHLRNEYGMSIMYISHDIASARYVSDYIVVMYLGVAVEYGPVEEIIKMPFHPYTKALINAVPSPDPDWIQHDLKILGEVGNSVDVHEGCRFYDRCVFRKDICEGTPPPVRRGTDRMYICHFDQDGLIENEEDENVEKTEEGDIEVFGSGGNTENKQ